MRQQGHLRHPDLSEARIATSAKPYMVLDAAEEYLACVQYAAKVQKLMEEMFLGSRERVLSYGPDFSKGKLFSVI